MRHSSLPFVALAGLLLALTGCRTPSRSVGKPDGGTVEIEVMPSVGTAPPWLSDAEMERRAKAHAAYAAGIVRQMRDDSGGMLDYWARSVEADPANVPLALEVARRRLIRRENPAAIAVLERVSSQSGKPVVGTVWSLLGLAYVQSGRTNDAIGAYRKGLGDQASRLGAYASLGRLLVESGRAEEAMTLLAEAEKQQPDDPIFQLDLAELYGQLVDRAPAVAERARHRAMAALDRVAELKPTEGAVLMRLADRNTAMGRSAEAEKILQQLRSGGSGGAMAAAKLAESQALGEKLAGSTCKLTQKAGVDGRLFGSVTNSDIAEELSKQGYKVVKAQVRMPNGPIKMVGDSTVSVALHTDVVVDITVSVYGETA
jgi:ribosomal protein L9